MTPPPKSKFDYYRKKFVVIDGPDGSGKSWLCEELYRYFCNHGLSVCCLREPGGTEIGEKIRDILLSGSNDDMDPMCELLLFSAARAQLIKEHIQPALDNCQLVLADRYVYSSMAYQFVRGLQLADILTVCGIVAKTFIPNAALIMDVHPDIARGRIPAAKTNRFDTAGVTFHTALRQAYLDMVGGIEGTVHRVDASLPKNLVFNQAVELLDKAIVPQTGVVL